MAVNKPQGTQGNSKEFVIFVVRFIFVINNNKFLMKV